MLHRMTTLLSTVVIAFLVASALNVVFATGARAADSCLARPTGSQPHGSHWYYQTNRVTHERCWGLGAKRMIVQNVALQKLPGLTEDSEPTERASAVSCTNTPNSRAPQGKHWYYRTDKATGQRCWHLGAQPSKIGNSVAARSSAPVELVAAETPATILSPAVADAKARFEDTSIALRSQIEMASSRAAAVTAEVANENLATSPFASRWIDLSDQAHSSNLQSNPVGRSEIHRPVTAVLEVTNSTKVGDQSYTTERPLGVTLTVLLVSLGGALAIFALIGRSLLYVRPTSPVGFDIAPQDDVFRIVGDLDTLGQSLASTAKPAGVRQRDVDSAQQNERDRQVPWRGENIPSRRFDRQSVAPLKSPQFVAKADAN
jgi:hypothetical protein